MKVIHTKLLDQLQQNLMQGEREMEINRFSIFLIMIISLIACRNSDEKKIVREIPTQAVIKYVDFEIETFYAIDKNSFEKSFSEDIKEITVKEKIFLDSLDQIITNLKPSAKGFKPDVRMIIKILYKDDRSKIIALSDIALEVNGVEMVFEPRLLSFIKTHLLLSTDIEQN
ncbi:MAG: hypothetical protein Q8N83_11180 [Ignavibacteria bacterium]|nr:hypothetical protein [Ignavibacteria bacterium]